MNTVRTLATTAVPVPSRSPFMFGFNSTAANHNSTLLAKFDYDLKRVLQAHPNTTSSYRSEL